MNVSDLRFYGRPISEAEGSWPKEVKARMRKGARQVIAGHLRLWQQVWFGFRFLRARRRARALDLTPFRERGLDNETFIKTQLEYLAFFVALTEIVGTERAVEIAKDVMDRTAREALLLCLPEAENVRKIGPPFTVIREYMRAMPAASCAGGCLNMDIVEDNDDAFQFNVSWCVWLELARAMGVPEACIPNCYSDDLVFPDYFARLGIQYRRTQTLAMGGKCCDFRFERRPDSGQPKEQ